jgi:transcriptional regulator with XRE-family HTH domain
MSDITNITESIAAAIRTRRNRLGMTQQDVAEITGLQRQTVSRVETGIEVVAFATVARVAAAVGLDLAVTPRYDDGRS